MTRWAADPRAARIAVPLDAMVAVYHRPSGATHLLASPAPELLEALGDGPADATELLARLAARFELADGDVAVIAARADELVETGLARRV